MGKTLRRGASSRGGGAGARLNVAVCWLVAALLTSAAQLSAQELRLEDQRFTVITNACTSNDLAYAGFDAVNIPVLNRDDE